MSLDQQIISHVVRQPLAMAELQRAGVTAEMFNGDYMKSPRVFRMGYADQKNTSHVCPICSEQFMGLRKQIFCGTKCSSAARTKARQQKWWKEHYRNGKRLCHSCKKFLSIKKFYVDRARPDGLALNCSKCARQKQEALRKRPGHVERVAADHRRRKYGISKSRYEELLNLQGGVCAVCRGKSDRNLAVDHDHSTGRVRGLLCDPCNLAIGLIKDNPATAKRIAKYLVAR